MQGKKLSRRLLSVVDMLPQCECIADVGCDHGMLGLHLLQTGKCDRLIASDISADSLQKAKRLYEKFSLADRADTLLCDGIPNGQAQAAVIAGIGGHVTMRILKSGLLAASGIDCILLQPADDAAYLRRGLNETGFDILEETIVYEGRYFPILRVRYDGAPREPMSEIACEIGPVNMMRPDKTVLNYARWRIRVWENAVRQPAASCRGQRNQQAASRLIRDLTLWCEVNAHAADAQDNR